MIRKQVLNGLLGVNADDSYKTHQPADAVSMVNTRIVDFVDGDTGDVQNVLGNALVANSELLAGASTCIGTVADEQDSKIYFFIFNHDNSTNHAIYEYDQSGGFNKLVSNGQFSGVGNTLGFGYSRITASALVSDFLVYSTGTGEVRAIDLDYWRNNTPTGVDPSFIDLNVIAPVHAPTWSMISASTPQDVNVPISIHKYRFFYRFEYEDGRISPPSPASNIKNVFDINLFDFESINIRVPLAQKIPAGVVKVQFIAYQLDADVYIVTNTVSNASAFADHNSGFQFLSVLFDGRALLGNVPAADMGITSFAVPRDVKALTTTKSRLFFSNYSDTLANDASVSIENVSAPVVQFQKTNSFSFGECFAENTFFSFGIRFIDDRGRTSPVYKLNSSFKTPTRHLNGTYVSPTINAAVIHIPDTNYDVDVYTNFIERVGISLANITNSMIPSWAKTAEIMVSNNRNHGDFVQFYLTSKNVTDVNDHPIVKYQFGLRYAHKLDDGTYVFANSSKFIRETYTYDADAVADPEPMRYYAVRLSDATDDALGWSYLPGDQIEVAFMKYEQLSASTSRYEEHVVSGQIIDVVDGHIIFGKEGEDIADYLGYTTDSSLVYSQGHQTPVRNSDYGVCTIRRPAQIDDTLFYETGVTFDVNNRPASVFVYGDCSFYKAKYVVEYLNQFDPPNQDVITKEVFLINSQGNPNSLVRTYDEYFGRSLVSFDLTSLILGDQKKTGLMFSGVYTSGTKNNNLNFLEVNDETILPSDLGEVNKLVMSSKASDIGTVLLAIGKNNTASVYVGEAQLVGSSADADLIVNRSVVGSVNILNGGYGTSHPESVVERNGSVYWYDAINAAVVRYGRNGMIPISEYKYNSTLNRITTGLSTQASIVGHFDPIQQEYLLSVSDPHRANTFSLSDYGVSTLISSNYITLGGNLSISLTGLSLDNVVEVRIQTLVNRDYTNLRVAFAGNTVYTSNSTTLDRTKPVYVRFVPTAANGSLLISGLATDPFGGQEVFVEVKKYGHDYSQIHHHMPITHAFNESANRWRGYDMYFSESSAIVNNVLYTFQNGLMYEHHYSNAATFYGITYPTAFSYYLDYQNVVSVPVSHSLETDVAPAKSRLQSENHATELVSADYVEQEDFFRSSFKRDKLSGNILTGKRVRGSKLLSLLRMPSTFSVKRIYTEVKDSTGH
jgi:hypothetical protein